VASARVERTRSKSLQSKHNLDPAARAARSPSPDALSHPEPLPARVIAKTHGRPRLSEKTGLLHGKGIGRRDPCHHRLRPHSPNGPMSLGDGWGASGEATAGDDSDEERGVGAHGHGHGGGQRDVAEAMAKLPQVVAIARREVHDTYKRDHILNLLIFRRVLRPARCS
jgi:hypothetical protein